MSLVYLEYQFDHAEFPYYLKDFISRLEGKFSRDTNKFIGIFADLYAQLETPQTARGIVGVVLDSQQEMQNLVSFVKSKGLGLIDLPAVDILFNSIV